MLDIEGLEAGLKPRMEANVTITRKDGTKEQIKLLCRLDTLDEVEYYRHGGILQFVLRMLLAQSGTAGSA